MLVMLLNTDPRIPMRHLLEENRMFIGYETAKWAKRQIITQTSLFFIGFAFNESKFQRLAGYAIDALYLDLRKGGNVNVRRVAQAMKDNDGSDWFDTGPNRKTLRHLTL